MRPCYIFDVDNTMADNSHRDPHNYETCMKDKPIKHVIDLAKVLGIGTPIIVTSGRPDSVRMQTQTWLGIHGVGYVMYAMYMRIDGDERPDHIVKKEMRDQMRQDGWSPIMAFDDRQKVVDMWRANGVPCAQVAPDPEAAQTKEKAEKKIARTILNELSEELLKRRDEMPPHFKPRSGLEMAAHIARTFIASSPD